ncbi:Apoptosis 2 inhibitor [Eufriesea mexicana]|nr:Apoptosis 2 inhibitor [Eufriesea mexicana]
MNVEEKRLRTFTNWPANAAVDAAQIAKAGFYYSGHALEVQCFLCGVKICNWNYGDQAIVRHRLAEPNCPFVQNPSSTCNVPLIPISILSEYSGLASSSIEVEQDNNVVEHQSANLSQARKDHWIMLYRLKSFTKWPIPSIVSPESLAKAGFYYLQCNDKVHCAYCGGILHQWTPGDDPDKEHRRHFPHCNFYVHQHKYDNLYLTNVKLMPGATSSLSDLGIQPHTIPKTPACRTYEKRLRTYNGWPKNIKQIPEILANAGFYYNGFGDHVRCFHCNGELRNWKITDDAWIEHARWFPTCEFVNLVRGKEFIKQCINSRPPLDQSILEGLTINENTDIAETSPSSSTILSSSSEITEATLKKLLESPPAIVALEIGLHIGRVKRALKKQIQEVGTPYTNSEQLIEDNLWDQDIGELASEQTNNSVEHCNNTEKYEYKDDEEHSVKNENSTTSNDKSNSVDKKPNINSKEIKEENRKLKEVRLCKICMDQEVAIVFLPCGHLATCVYCASSLTYCPMCQQEIKATVRTFLS